MIVSPVTTHTVAARVQAVSPQSGTGQLRRGTMASPPPPPPPTSTVTIGVPAAPLSPAPASMRDPAVRDARLRWADAALAGAWRRGWADLPSLDPAALIARAEAKTGGRMDHDPSGWRERLELLCADLEDTAALTPLGRTIAHGQLVAALANRIRFNILWQQRPEIAAQPIRAPIVVVGQMRSGTTRVQRLLACDPRLAYTRFFESWNPMPQRPERRWIDDRKVRGWLAVMSARLLNPDFDTIHPTRWNAPDEEIGLQSVSIFGSAFEAQWRVPRFVAAVEADEGTATYAEFRRLLQTIAWLRGEDGSRPWILKVPQFSQDLAAVLRTFPDARLVCLHRDRHQVIASSASLVRNQMALQSAEVDAAWIGREWTRKIALRDHRTAIARARSDAPQVDVAFADVNADWAQEMGRVYRMLGLPLTTPVLARMRAYIERSAGGSHARHNYRPDDFGLGDREAAAMPLAVPAAA